MTENSQAIYKGAINLFAKVPKEDLEKLPQFPWSLGQIRYVDQDGLHSHLRFQFKKNVEFVVLGSKKLGKILAEGSTVTLAAGQCISWHSQATYHPIIFWKDKSTFTIGLWVSGKFKAYTMPSDGAWTIGMDLPIMGQIGTKHPNDPQ